MPRTRVLVVDDDPTVRQTMCAALRDEGYDVSEASDGAMGLARAATFQPQVILVDLVMPTMNGYAFLAAFRRASADSGVQVPPARLIATSAVARQSPPDADDFLPKPFQLDDLLTMVAHHAGMAA